LKLILKTDIFVTKFLIGYHWPMFLQRKKINSSLNWIFERV